MKYKDYPLQDCVEQIDLIRKQNPDAKAYQKFTCESCGSRQTIDEADRFYTSGQCEECQHVTDIAKHGCNYIIIFGGN